MAPKKQSIFRQPGARHFQLVHRSQRDPLIHDPEASQHVLKSFERENVKKGKSRVELESYLSPSDLAHDLQRANIGEAALYGIYYDDTEYDYMRHLKQFGAQEEGVDSVLIEAPAQSQSKAKGKNKAPIELKDLPPEALPSTSELPRNYEAQQPVPSSIAGFQPDMDPHLRQTLEALEDDAFVDEGLEDDFFSELVADGERAEYEDFEYEFREDGMAEGEAEFNDEETEEGEEAEQSWEARFKQFKAAQKQSGRPNDAASDLDEEDRDTVSLLPQISVIGGKKRRKNTSDASGYSMSSSSMYRNEHLSVLDERFDAIEHEYDEFFEDEPEDDDSDGDEAPDLLASRADFESMLDEFLTDYEILGGKMKHRLEGDTAAEKLDAFRRAIGQPLRVREGEEEEDIEEHPWFREEEKEDKWDCETILTTYSNLENHPRMISARSAKPVPKIWLDPRTGLPTVQEKSDLKSKGNLPKDEDDDSDLTETERSASTRVTVARSRDESKEEKKARKQTVKAERRTRRAEKKSTKVEFTSEFKRQASGIAQKGNPRVRKL